MPFQGRESVNSPQGNKRSQMQGTPMPIGKHEVMVSHSGRNVIGKTLIMMATALKHIYKK